MKAPKALTRRAGVAGSEVCVAWVGVPARKEARLPKVRTPPVPPLKLLLSKRRYSAPIRMECRPWIQPRVSLYSYVVSPRPCGKPEMPPKVRAPGTVICGNTDDGDEMPKAAGVWVKTGRKSMRTRLRPAWASLVMLGEMTRVKPSARK